MGAHPPRLTAATVALAASAAWMNEKQAPPSPTIGSRRRRIDSWIPPPGAYSVPGP